MQPGDVLRFPVVGNPRPQGSKSAFAVTKKNATTGKREPVFRDGKPVISVAEQGRKELAPWRSDVAEAAVHAYRPIYGLDPTPGPVFVRLTFYRPRPASHYRKDGSLRDAAELYPDTWFDLDKLARAALDAMTGIIFVNDARVVTLPLRKRYGAPARLEVLVRRPRAATVGELRQLRDLGDERAEAELAQLALV